MLDAVSVIVTAAVFGLALLYVNGCDHLKGARS